MRSADRVVACSSRSATGSGRSSAGAHVAWSAMGIRVRAATPASVIAEREVFSRTFSDREEELESTRVDVDPEPGSRRRRPSTGLRTGVVAGDMTVGPVIEERDVEEGFGLGRGGEVADRGGDHVAAPRVLERDEESEVLQQIAHPRRTREATDSADLQIDRD